MGRQWKVNMFDEHGSLYLVNSKATERHVHESQGSLDLWAKEQAMLEDWLDPWHGQEAFVIHSATLVQVLYTKDIV